MSGQPTGMYASPGRAEEQRDRIPEFAQARTGMCQVALHPLHRPGADGNVPVLSSFALFDPQDAAVKIQIRQVQLAEFVSSDARGIENFENGAVTQAEGAGHIGHPQDPLDFMVA